MNYIDEKFKDEKPEITVENIINKLNTVGIKLEENWNDSQIENCHSVRVTAEGGIPGTNGKGISYKFARASAYGEFMERLQSGLFFYKYQSFENDESVNLQSFAPDKCYMTKAELLDNSEWMCQITERYGISKENIADQCQIYACSDKILMLPYYSIFEDKYVYLPSSFIEHMYSANGCCVGNTREEAWIHAISEILERHSNIEVMKSGKSVPIIPRSKLKKFDAVESILNKIDEQGIYDVEILDYSCGKKFPVIATRIINKKTKGYLVNVGADPVFEIAVQRTLTEIFQGRNLSNFTSKHKGKILGDVDDIGMADNIINQLETGNGVYTAEFFSDSCENESPIDWPLDNNDKTNTELLKQMLELLKKLNIPVYVRNYSFLGFPCYKFIMPGYSESRGARLTEVIPTYYFADRAAKTLHNIKKADINQLNELLLYHKMINNFISKRNNFNYLSGLPIAKLTSNIASIHFAYASLKIKNYKSFDYYMDSAISCTPADNEDKDYLMAVKQWVEFEKNGVEKNKALTVISKFYFEYTVERLKQNLKNNTLLDEFLVECGECHKCKYKDNCCYDSIRGIINNAGSEYNKFIDGQAKENFVF